MSRNYRCCAACGRETAARDGLCYRCLGPSGGRRPRDDRDRDRDCDDDDANAGPEDAGGNDHDRAYQGDGRDDL